MVVQVSNRAYFPRNPHLQPWYDRFNYVTSAALDGGTTIAVLVIFLAVQIHQSQGLSWWGNNLNLNSE
jgi:hypothetical protein